MCCMFSRVRLREQAHRCLYARVCVYCHDAAWVINDGVRLWGFSLAVACGRSTSRHILCFVWNSLLALPLRWRLLVWQTARSNCNLTNAKKKKCAEKFKHSAESPIFHQLPVANGGWSRMEHPQQIAPVFTAVMDGAHTSPEQKLNRWIITKSRPCGSVCALKAAVYTLLGWIKSCWIWTKAFSCSAWTLNTERSRGSFPSSEIV